MKDIFRNSFPRIFRKLYFIKLYYKKFFIRESFYQKIIKQQLSLLSLKYNSDTDKLIVFFVPGSDIITGGLISISSIYDETVKLQNIHKSAVIASKYPFDYHQVTFTRFSKFKNNMDIYLFESIQKYFTKLISITVHMPENTVIYFVDNLRHVCVNRTSDWWYNIPNRHINILNQNIQFMPPVDYINKLRTVSTKLTQTTAHDKYSTMAIRNKYNIPLHQLSVSFSSFWDVSFRKDYRLKEKIIMISPDYVKQKKRIISKLKSELPMYQIIEVRNMPFQEFHRLASVCKFAITFGEGLDGYCTTAFVYGGISFAVYNEDFFMPEYKDILTFYKSYEQMYDRIIDDIITYENDEAKYEICNNSFIEIFNSYYSDRKYVNNIRQFYLDEYLFP